MQNPQSSVLDAVGEGKALGIQEFPQAQGPAHCVSYSLELVSVYVADLFENSVGLEHCSNGFSEP